MHVNCTQGRRVGKIKFTRNREMDGQGLGSSPRIYSLEKGRTA